MFEQALDTALLTFSKMRSLGFTLEFLAMNALSDHLIPGSKVARHPVDPSAVPLIQKELFECLRQDARNIRMGVYPMSVLLPEAPLEHLRRIPKIVWDGYRIYRRRMAGRTTEFGKSARQFLDDLPRYYRRNFHF